jgi:hypothetical protein
VEKADLNSDDNAWLIGNIDLVQETSETQATKPNKIRKRNLDLEDETIQTIDARTLTGIPQDPIQEEIHGAPQAHGAPQPQQEIPQRANGNPTTPLQRSQQLFQHAREQQQQQPLNTNIVTPYRAGANTYTGQQSSEQEPGRANQAGRGPPPERRSRGGRGGGRGRFGGA